MWISDQLQSIVSCVRVAVRTQNRSARATSAAGPEHAANSAMIIGTSAEGNAA